MAQRIPGRSNDAWIAALRGEGDDHAQVVAELAAYLRRAVGKGVHGRLDAAELAEVVHESLGRVIQALPSFRGDSAFTTWATGVALRVAFTELRRRHARERSRQAFEALEIEVRQLTGTRIPAPDEALSQADLRRALEHAIATRLTERQRLAIVAELRGIPTVEIARRLGTNPNALYKLTHDARRRLRQALVEAGFSAESIHAHASEAPSCP